MRGKRQQLPSCYRELVYRWATLELSRYVTGQPEQNFQAAIEWSLVKPELNDYDRLMEKLDAVGLLIFPVIVGPRITFTLCAPKRMVAALKIERRPQEEGDFVERLVQSL